MIDNARNPKHVTFVIDSNLIQGEISLFYLPRIVPRRERFTAYRLRGISAKEACVR